MIATEIFLREEVPTTDAQAIYFVRLRKQVVICEATPENEQERAARLAAVQSYFNSSAPAVAISCVACPWAKFCRVWASMAVAVV